LLQNIDVGSYYAGVCRKHALGCTAAKGASRLTDTASATKKLEMSERVPNCIGQLLADFVIEAAKPSKAHAEGGCQGGGNCGASR
jgi:hypothetical protein